MSESSQNTSDTAKSCGTSACGGRWKLPVLFALVLAAIVAFRISNNGETQVQHSESPAAESAPSATSETVSLSIRFADGSERKFDALAWREGMTAADLMKAASQQANGVSYALRGSGEMAFLIRINETENEGASGQNWTYSVNGTKADRSFAIYELRPGDQVLWTFAEAE